jgi:curved DNA-binding protein CbpA
MTQQSPETQEAFRLLGVAPDATPEAVRAAWRAMVRAYHPDQYRGDKEAASRRLAELNAAFDVVSAAQPKTSVKSSRQRATAQSDRDARRRAARRATEARQHAETLRKAEQQARKEAALRRAATRASTRPQSAAERGFGAALSALTPRGRARHIGFA